MSQHLNDASRIDVFLDDDPKPVVSYRPPVRFELDTAQLEDGPHVMRVEAYDSAGSKGVRTVRFTVRNGPGIAIDGLRDRDVLEGKIPILVNSYAGANETFWEPSRAETPAPVPTWTWVLVILVVAFGAFYGVRQWNPPPAFADSPTFGGFEQVVEQPEPAPTGAEPAKGAAAQAEPAAAAPADAALGAQVFGSHCAACHQPSGQGLPGVFPPLAGDPVVTAADPSEHIRTVLHGKQGSTIDGVAYSSPMPAFAAQLSDEQVAAVVNHERSSWGNSAPLVTPRDVAELR